MIKRFPWMIAWFSVAASAAAGTPQHILEPSQDRWMYPANGTPGTRAQASTFSALPGAADLDDRWAFFLFAFDTGTAVPAGLPPEFYQIKAIKVTATIGQDQLFRYDPSYDGWRTYATPAVPASEADPDAGRPLELHGAGFRNGFTAATFTETSLYGGNGNPGTRNAYPLGFDETGAARDVSSNVTGQFESVPWAVGSSGLDAGALVPEGTVFSFHIDSSSPGVSTYLRDGLSAGRIWFSLDSLHPATQQAGEFVAWYTKDDVYHQLFGGIAPTLGLDVELVFPLSISRVENSVTLSWPEFAGLNFALQSSPSLASGTWQTVHQHAAGVDGDGSFTESIGPGRRFYQLAITPATP